MYGFVVSLPALLGDSLIPHRINVNKDSTEDLNSCSDHKNWNSFDIIVLCIHGMREESTPTQLC